MKIDVYKTKNPPPLEPRGMRYIMLESGAGTDYLPQEVVEQAGGLFFFRTMTIRSGEKRIALDDEAIPNIERDNYHIQDVKIEIGP